MISLIHNTLQNVNIMLTSTISYTNKLNIYKIKINKTIKHKLKLIKLNEQLIKLNEQLIIWRGIECSDREEGSRRGGQHGLKLLEVEEDHGEELQHRVIL
jgi:hypothetical protein